MKTKIIPFDLETAKKIQAGEIEGKIIYNSSEAEILDFNLYFKECTYVCAKVKNNSGEYSVRLFDKYGKDAESCIYYNLIIEVPDNEPQFKPFDKVLMRSPSSGYECWYPHFYCRYIQNAVDKKPYVSLEGFGYEQCIPYEGNEHLVGTTDKPKEE